mmetsp:Transcript_37980/g.60013  ORF Transcript_37980/g.60013 Transcript_37980/m.60013 type:complete len:215 (-) Transcript_37980:410-1054(-)
MVQLGKSVLMALSQQTWEHARVSVQGFSGEEFQSDVAAAGCCLHHHVDCGSLPRLDQRFDGLAQRPLPRHRTGGDLLYCGLHNPHLYHGNLLHEGTLSHQLLAHGCDDSDVGHVLGHDSCCGPDYDAFPDCSHSLLLDDGCNSGLKGVDAKGSKAVDPMLGAGLGRRCGVQCFGESLSSTRIGSRHFGFYRIIHAPVVYLFNGCRSLFASLSAR